MKKENLKKCLTHSNVPFSTKMNLSKNSHENKFILKLNTLLLHVDNLNIHFIQRKNLLIGWRVTCSSQIIWHADIFMQNETLCVSSPLFFFSVICSGNNIISSISGIKSTNNSYKNIIFLHRASSHQVIYDEFGINDKNEISIQKFIFEWFTMNVYLQPPSSNLHINHK